MKSNKLLRNTNGPNASHGQKNKLESIVLSAQSGSYVDIPRISHIMPFRLDLLIAVGSAAIF